MSVMLLCFKKQLTCSTSRTTSWRYLRTATSSSSSSSLVFVCGNDGTTSLQSNKSITAVSQKQKVCYYSKKAQDDYGKNKKQFDYNKMLDDATKGKLDYKTNIPKTLSREKHVPNLRDPSIGNRHNREIITKDDDIFYNAETAVEDIDRTPMFNAMEQSKNNNNNNTSMFTMDDFLLYLDHNMEKYYWTEAYYDNNNTDDDEEMNRLLSTSNNNNEVLKASSITNDNKTGEDEIDGMNDNEEDIGNNNDEDEGGVDKKDITDIQKEQEDAFRNELRAKFGKNSDILELLTTTTSDEQENSSTNPHEKFTDYDREQELYKYNTTVTEGIIDLSEPQPTKYVAQYFETLHRDSQREPIPHYPKQQYRANPPVDTYLDVYKRFLYVTGLPVENNTFSDKNKFDINNPIDRSTLQQKIATLVGVDSTQVYPVNANSAYVGFKSISDLGHAILNGPTQDYIVSTPQFTIYQGEHEFAINKPTLLLDNIPKGNTSISLLRKLFQSSSSSTSEQIGDIGNIYNVTESDILFLSSTQALIRFNTQDEAYAVLESNIIKEQLNEIGKYHIMYLRAQRVLKHKKINKFGEEIRQLGSRLIVDGDRPTRKFYISHAGTLLFGNVDPALTKDDITDLVQPYCTMTRYDVENSIEFVTCMNGHRTGNVYVGFDLPGEAEVALAGLTSRTKIGDRISYIKLVKDRKIPKQTYIGPERRPDRQIDELLKDINDWEQHVDPTDVQILLDAGISKHILDDALRSIRKNATFGTLDYTVRNESLEPEKYRGQQYIDIVQLYIKTLIECIPTRDNPGLLYEALHLPNEEIDLTIFNKEEQRQMKMKQEREVGLRFVNK